MAWWPNLKARWASYLTIPAAPYDTGTDVEQEMDRERLSADALHLVMNRIRGRLGIEDEIEDPHSDTSERLAPGDRYLLWVPVIAAMLKEIDEIRAAVWFGEAK